MGFRRHREGGGVLSLCGRVEMKIYEVFVIQFYKYLSVDIGLFSVEPRLIPKAFRREIVAE